MDFRPFRLSGRVSPAVYAVAAPLVLLSQHLAVALCYRLRGAPLEADYGFWLLPLRRLANMPGLTSPMAATVFAIGFLVAWCLAVLSFRRASWSNRGHWLSLFAIFPAIQIAVVAALACTPRRGEPQGPPEVDRIDLADVLQGVIAGVAIIVAAVLISALTLGAYGWGLFVTTPLVVGMTTGYIANRRVLRSNASTAGYVAQAGALGGMALLMLALEGLMCILLIAPLGLAASVLGGWVGRTIARVGHHRGTPLMSVAVLPMLFALEAAMPPAVPIDTREAIDIAAPPAAVWRVITGDRTIDLSPGLPGLAGLAYPLRGRLLGEGVGARRLGIFSTGTAEERVTEWQPGRLLAFTVLSQPPAMEEMSPYREVHAPHLYGYVVSGDTRYRLTPLAGGSTRLTLEATTVLHIDPIAYWEPIARWAFRTNLRRVLANAKQQAEQS
jgi:uncharacterized protein YndB with AHSA1/START domain